MPQPTKGRDSVPALMSLGPAHWCHVLLCYPDEMHDPSLMNPTVTEGQSQLSYSQDLGASFLASGSEE